MKKSRILILAGTLLLGACGDMSHNVNEDESNYVDSAGMNPDDMGNPKATHAPIRDVYNTDTSSATVGPDNAPPHEPGADTGMRH